MSRAAGAAGVAGVALLALGLAGCDGSNPVAPGGPFDDVSNVTFNIQLAAEKGQVPVGDEDGITIQITVRRASDGTAPADGTSVTVSTSLGNFGFGANGPLLSVFVTLTAGRGSVQFFPGDKIGTAEILAALGSSAGKLTLSIVEPLPGPEAAFSFKVTGLSVTFLDQSTGGPTSWLWEFGDGATSTLQNPAHTYAAAGDFVVKLTASNANGSGSSAQIVTAGGDAEAPKASFEFKADGLTVTFADSSTGNPTSWSWSFGDGETSTQQNPVHTYGAAGNYTVQLTVSNRAGSNSKSQIISVGTGADAPVAAFSFKVSGLTVTFADESTGAPTSWAWEFGDGATSTLQNPTRTYAASGNYTVKLTVTNSAGSSSKSQIVSVATAAPVADFTFSTGGGLTVAFTDRSTGGPTSWSWDFGDGATSTLQNPVHTYSAAAEYVVKLTVTSAGGTSSVSKVVNLQTPPIADFEFVQNQCSGLFSDRSSGNPTSWSWDFGDGGSSTLQNPVHSYGPAASCPFGTYTVTLTVANSQGTSTVSRPITLAPF